MAREKNLSHHPYWHRLIHYRKIGFGGYLSEVDDPNFFLAPNGKHDPEAELQATLAAFHSPSSIDPSVEPAPCSFIARYHWLKQHVDLSYLQLSISSCQRYTRWVNELNPESVSVIFPSAYMNNPASMFGHTFLRINQIGQTSGTTILAYTINYAANVPPNPGIEYAFKGIFGWYHGRFSTLPYYMKIQEYQDLENRDMWEYQLTLTKKQTLRMLRHVWELRNIYFDYFFIKENCAYHLLSLLEVANPQLHLTEHFTFWTVPANTIRWIARQPGLVKATTFRPSQSTAIQRKYQSLTPGEKESLFALMAHPPSSQDPTFKKLPPVRQAFLLELVSDSLQYHYRSPREKTTDYARKNREILAIRSQIPNSSPPFSIKPFTRSPTEGHDSTRLAVGMGWRQGTFFEEIALRAGYHDLLDPEDGYTRDAQIELLSLKARHYSQPHHFRLEELTVANILSLSPITFLSQKPSWKLRLGMDSLRIHECKWCSAGRVNGGIGMAHESYLINREVAFLFAEVDGNVSKAFQGNYRIGGGLSAGLLFTLTQDWKVLITGGYLWYPLGDRSMDIPISVDQRVTLAKNLAFRTEYSHNHRDNEILAMVHGYF